MGKSKNKVPYPLKELYRNYNLSYRELFPDTLRVVGNLEDRAICANIAESKSSMLKIIKAHLLLKFCDTENFNDQELIAFKKGLDSYYNFFFDCAEDIRKTNEILVKRSESARKSIDNNSI